ncbi:MAG: hypothetical protein KC417_05945, partial [Myxococcales bacterium]|nr:hypothetical protein [Myxococcales bacterium]
SSSSSSSSGHSDVRLAIQARLDALNLVHEMGGALGAVTPLTPFATIGVRILDERLFLGAGLGFAGGSRDVAAGAEQGRAAFAFTPVASFDVLTTEFAALYFIGMFNLISLGETSTDTAAGSANANDDVFGIGLNAGAGIRGKINESLAIGGEFGWGFSALNGPGDSFDHGFWGTLMFEASIGL